MSEEMTSVINIRVDAATKKEANTILENLGLNMTTAINLFLRQVVKRDGIPFEIVNERPSWELRKALKEADEILSGKKKAKGYHDVDAMFEEVLNGKK